MKTIKRMIRTSAGFAVLCIAQLVRMTCTIGQGKFIFTTLGFAPSLFGSFLLGRELAALLITKWFFVVILGSAFLGTKLTLAPVVLGLGLPTWCAAMCWRVRQSKQAQLQSLEHQKELCDSCPGVQACKYAAFRVPLHLELANIMLKIALPLICMILFILHPEGSKAFIFSFYWFIPMMLYIVEESLVSAVKSPIITAYQSTFVAHAVGSVLYLYLFDIPAAYWIGLTGVVAVERTVFAVGMVLVYYAAVGFVKQAETRQWTWLLAKKRTV